MQALALFSIRYSMLAYRCQSLFCKKTGLLQDRADDACWWECRGRLPFAGTRGVLAFFFLSQSAEGENVPSRITCVCICFTGYSARHKEQIDIRVGRI